MRKTIGKNCRTVYDDGTSYIHAWEIIPSWYPWHISLLWHHWCVSCCMKLILWRQTHLTIRTWIDVHILTPQSLTIYLWNGLWTCGGMYESSDSYRVVYSTPWFAYAKNHKIIRDCKEYIVIGWSDARGKGT